MIPVLSSAGSSSIKFRDALGDGTLAAVAHRVV